MDKSKAIIEKFDEILELAGKPKLSTMLETTFAGMSDTEEMRRVVQSVYDEIAEGLASGTAKFQGELEKALRDKEAMDKLAKGVKDEVD